MKPFDTTLLYSQLESKCEKLGLSVGEFTLVASVPAQKIALLQNGVPVKIYAISSSRAAPSCVKDSLGTPDGLFTICEKIGDGAPAGTVFVARKSTGTHFSDYLRERPELGNANLITSRILRLTGEELGHNLGGNVDTFERFVYIHGTNQEEKLGTPNSHGCLLLGNADIIELFDFVPTGTRLLISLD